MSNQGIPCESKLYGAPAGIHSIHGVSASARLAQRDVSIDLLVSV